MDDDTAKALSDLYNFLVHPRAIDEIAFKQLAALIAVASRDLTSAINKKMKYK